MRKTGKTPGRRLRLAAFLAGLVLLSSTPVLGHLCNDVFAQARDNLAVKVDVRDGQLRIGSRASFRVYLLNTMDRQIDRIGLQVESQAFDADVQPAPDWREHPALRAVEKGGRKVFFTVTLTRRPGLPDGRYTVSLKLTADRRGRKSFKVVDLEEAADLVDLPAAAAPVTIDGVQDRAEWGEAALCTAFYERRKKGGYLTNVSSEIQSRVRFLHDEDSLYCAFAMHRPQDQAARADRGVLYLAADYDSAPVSVAFDAVAGTVSCDRPANVEYRFNEDRTLVEARLPLAALGLAGRSNFHLNLARTTRLRSGEEHVTYWRGNEQSVEQPMVFGNFVLAGETTPAATPPPPPPPPPAPPAAAGLAPGLVGEYFVGRDFASDRRRLSRVEPQVDFDWGTDAPSRRVPVDHFCVRWRGLLLAPVAGEYLLEVETDDGVRLFLDDRRVIDNWVDRAPTADRATVTLTAGAHAIRLEYYEATGGAVCRLRWRPPDGRLAAVPPENLRHDPGGVGEESSQ